MEDSPLFTVFGGTGFLGSRIVRHLSTAGCRVRIAARHPDRRPELLELTGVEAVHADLFKDATLSGALEGAQGAVNATSLYLENGKLTFEAVHITAAGQLAALAKDKGLRRYVQISGIGSDPTANDAYIRARGRGEIAVQQAFAGATIVRPAVMFGSNDALLTAIRKTARILPFFPLFGSGRTKLQPGWVSDVAAAIAQLLQADTGRPYYELAGPDVFTYRELIETVADADNQHVRRLSVPFGMWRVMALIAERLPGAPLTRSQVALMQNDNVANGSMPGLTELDIAPISLKNFLSNNR